MSIPTDAAARGVRRRARTRSKVLDAAEWLMSQTDTGEIRIEDVAARAGVSQASIYVHFGTKGGLQAATVDRLLHIATDRLTAAFEAPTTPLERFRGVGVAYLRLLLDHPAVLKYVTTTGSREPESEFERDADVRLVTLRAKFEACIQDVIDDGAIRPVDARSLSYFLLGAWNGVAALSLRRDGLALSTAAAQKAVLQAGEALVAGLVI